ncbi:hypothetical protein DNH61_04940 [Paenibacillus sambharensis]|uniref:Uncharacterized protein n=1 Tax=Paenibacillus sambharensis TaxID=1803190 RepID=A0A2W1LD18_9BACL|nr:hypothetical protein [Paenibacillus sambharensis]PZD96996.1 hypothetical protein DNH61_04940 [Paenibacillus sambharensis]
MKCLAEQPYYKVKRVVTGLEQQNIVADRMMYLYVDKIVTQHRQFPIRDVFDMSYRRLGGGEGGFLYLHTSKGVYSYTVHEDPQPFIRIFKDHSAKIWKKNEY